MSLWHGRFQGQPDRQMWELNASIGFDIRMAEQDVRGSLAWAEAICSAGILTKEEYDQISKGLKSILMEFQDESFIIKSHPGSRPNMVSPLSIGNECQAPVPKR